MAKRGRRMRERRGRRELTSPVIRVKLVLRATAVTFCRGCCEREGRCPRPVAGARNVGANILKQES